MTVVALSWAYPPMRYPQAIQIARLVAHLEGDVHVVAAKEDGNLDPSLERAYGAAARVTRVRASRGVQLAAKLLQRGRLMVPDEALPWVLGATRAVRRALDRGDLLMTFGQPMSDHLAGVLAGGSSPWVAHFSDPWVDNPFRSDPALVRRVNERLERLVIERADAVVFTSDATVDLVMGKYPDAWRSKVHVVPHSLDPALYPAGESSRNGGVVLRYVGNFYGHRSPEPLFRALAEARSRRPELVDGAVVEIVGSIQQPVSEQPSARDLPEGMVRTREPVDYAESLALMRSSDVLLVVDAPAEVSVFLPSKLVDYLGAERPIVALTPPGAAADLVRRADGWVADPADPGAGAAALIGALEAAAQGGGRPPAEVRREYEADVVARRMAAVLDAARDRHRERKG